MLTIHISYCNHVYKRINAFECICMNNIIHTYTHIHMHINHQIHTHTLYIYYGTYIRPTTNMQCVIIMCIL